MFEELSVRTVESELVELAGHLAAATCRFLQLLAEFDTRGGWSGTGVRSCSHWLNWRVGLSLRAAREHLRVAHALVGLPAITEAFADGRVSYLRVRDRDHCVFPGCPQTRHLQAHHVRWWWHGRTDLDNLALLCTFHHHLVHDQGFQLRSDGEGGFIAARPDATPIPAAGAPTHGRPEAIREPGIDNRTITPRWGGERLDLDYVMACLFPAAA